MTGRLLADRRTASLTHLVCSLVVHAYELCCRTASFIKSCLESDSPNVSTVARYGIYYCHMNSHLGQNALGSLHILSVIRHVVTHYVNSHISTQHRASVLFLLELLFVRDILYCRQICLLILYAFLDVNCAFCALTLLVGWQEGHPACKKRVVGY